MDWMCDKEKLWSVIADETSELAFYCGNASNIDDILPFFDKVILLKISPEVMRQRLTNRVENDFGSTRDVQDWIMTWKEWWEDDMQKNGAIPINAHGSLDEVTKDILISSH